jgi:hypothetical protein
VTTGRKTKASKPSPNDTFQGAALVLTASQETRRKAAHNIRVMVHNGELTQAEPGWRGSVAGFYLSVLGLD